MRLLGKLHVQLFLAIAAGILFAPYGRPGRSSSSPWATCSWG